MKKSIVSAVIGAMALSAMTASVSAEQELTALTYDIRSYAGIMNVINAKVTVISVYESSLVSDASWTADDEWETKSDEEGNTYQEQIDGIDTGFITFGADNGFITGGDIFDKDGTKVGFAENTGDMIGFEFTARPFKDIVNDVEDKYQTIKVTNDAGNTEGAYYDAELGGMAYDMRISSEGSAAGHFDLSRYDLYKLGYNDEDKALAAGIQPVSEETYGVRDAVVKMTYSIPNTVKLNDSDVKMTADVFAQGFWNSEGKRKGVVQTPESLISAPTTTAIGSFTIGASEETAVSSFVDRLYKILLGRNAEEAGLADWTNKLKNGEATSAEIVYGIAGSQEFADFGLSNEDIVEKLYLAMLDRPSDEAGKLYWVERLEAGMSVNAIINGFSGSQEFAGICGGYGIQAGSISELEPRDRNFELTAFVSRMYTKALGRGYDVYGLNYWVNRYLTGEIMADGIARGFILSHEFFCKDLSDSEYVDVLYRTFFNRDADACGKEHWISRLESGDSREDVMNGFLRSEEFRLLAEHFGVQ